MTGKVILRTRSSKYSQDSQFSSYDAASKTPESEMNRQKPSWAQLAGQLSSQTPVSSETRTVDTKDIEAKSTELGQSESLEDEKVRSIIEKLDPDTNTYRAVKNQQSGRQRLYLNGHNDYGMSFLCTKHSVYGTGVRRYLFCGNASSDPGQACLVFLTMVSRQRSGPDRSLHWFLEPICYKLKGKLYKDDNVFVTWTQAIAVTPIDKDYIEGVKASSQLLGKDSRKLWNKMSHFINDHPSLMSLLCKHHHKKLGFSSRNERQEAYHEIEKALHTSEFCERKSCRLLEDLKHKFYEAKKSESRLFPIKVPDDKRKRRKPVSEDNKCHPPEDLCECLTGRVVPFDPSIHILEE